MNSSSLFAEATHQHDETFNKFKKQIKVRQNNRERKVSNAYIALEDIY